MLLTSGVPTDAVQSTDKPSTVAVTEKPTEYVQSYAPLTTGSIEAQKISTTSPASTDAPVIISTVQPTEDIVGSGKL